MHSQPCGERFPALVIGFIRVYLAVAYVCLIHGRNVSLSWRCGEINVVIFRDRSLRVQSKRVQTRPISAYTQPRAMQYVCIITVTEAHDPKTQS